MWLVIALAALIAWNWGQISRSALARTAYSARVACSCVHIAGRDLDACKAGIVSRFSPIVLTQDAEDRTVTARVPFVVSQTARWQDGPGCQLEPWAP